MELSSTDQAMEEIIRVMSDGREIDRIVRSAQLNEGMPTVKYREQYWPVVDGCIQLDGPANQECSSAEWAALIQNLYRRCFLIKQIPARSCCGTASGEAYRLV